MESSETAGERALTKLEIQLDLIAQAFGEERFGKKFFDDGTLDYLYVRGVILVRDVYQPDVARVLEEQDEEEERGQEFVRVAGLLPRGVSSCWRKAPIVAESRLARSSWAGSLPVCWWR